MKIRNIETNTTQKLVNLMCTDGKSYTLSSQASRMFFQGDKAGLRDLIRGIETQLTDISELTKKTADDIISVDSLSANYVSADTLEAAYERISTLRQEAIGLLLAIIAVDEFSVKLSPTPPPPSQPQPTPRAKIFATVNDRNTLEEIEIDPSIKEFVLQLAEQVTGEPSYFDLPAFWKNVQTEEWDETNQLYVATKSYMPDTVIHDVDNVPTDYYRYRDTVQPDKPATRIKITWQ